MKTVLAIIAVALIGYSLPAYADEIPFPVLPTDNWTGTDVKTFYPTNSSYIVQISVHYSVASPLEVIQDFTWSDITGQTHTMQLQEEFTVQHYPAEEKETIIVPKQVYTPEQIERILEEKKDELKISEENGYAKLRQCMVEFEVEQPVRFEAWKRTAGLVEFTIPDQKINSDTYDRIQLEAMKKWTICKMLKEYKFIGAYEANKSIDEPIGYALDESDDPRTIPVTEADIKAEEQRASDFACSNIGHYRGLCIQEFTGINRGNPDGYEVPSWYGTWRELNAEKTDAQGAIERALVAQCDNYYHLYKHKVGTENFPVWLEHCTP